MASSLPTGTGSRKAANTRISYSRKEYGKVAHEISNRLRSNGINSDVFGSLESEEFEDEFDGANLIILSAASADETLRYLDKGVDEGVRTIWVFMEPYSEDLEATVRSEHYVDRVENWSSFQPSFIDDIATEIVSLKNGIWKRLDAVILTLVDGRDDERLRVLEDIRRNPQNFPILASRLRDEVSGAFGVRRQRVFAAAERDPESVTAIRSWMMSCLVTLAADDSRTKAVALRHLSDKYEPARNTRFWLLGSLCLANAPYLEEACKVASSDGMIEVRTLASAILDRLMPGSSSIWGDLQKSLYSEDFTTAWSVLRVLRIVPNTQLLQDVYAQIGRRAERTELTYDALYALANQAMAAHAAEHLSADQILRIVSVVLQVSQDSNEVGKRRFSELLESLGPTATSEIRRLSREDIIAGQILRYINQKRYRGGGATHDVIAGFNSDRINIENDYLGISNDVKTLSSVVMARDVTPPIAIGLFGGWGTGKSFFIKKMQAETKRIADREKQKPTERYCSSIVSIEFNAWHYTDANLWASLVNHIIDSLSKALCSDQETPEEKRIRLVNELTTTQKIISDIKSEEAAAKTVLSEKQTALSEIRTELQKKELQLSDLKISDVKAVLDTDDELRGKLESALKDLGVPALLASAEDLKKAADSVAAAHGRAGSLIAQISKVKGGQIYWSLIAFIVALPFLAATAYQCIPWLQRISAGFIETSGTILSVSATLAAIATYLKRVSEKFNSSIDKFEQAKALLDKRLAAKRADIGAAGRDLESEIKALQAQELDVTNRLNAASNRVADIEAKLKSLQEEGSLAKFLSDRSGADDYRKHLGIMSTIRQDFEDLSRRLLAAQAAEDGASLQGVDRIFLYIDDLDRCPAENVVAVLQAVHLMLAFELFVVVVGVDPSWLKNSLKTQYPQIGLQPNGGAMIAPQKYIEKIFQIPVRLRPMSEAGYGRLVRGLLRPAEQAVEASSQSGVTTRPMVGNTASATVMKTDVASQGYVSTSKMGPDGGADLSVVSSSPLTSGSPAPSSSADVAIEALTISDLEADCAEQLFLLMANPRAAKRFTNIYRILKASVPASELNQFEGSREMPGHFRVIMLLLALSTAFPSATAELLRDIIKASQEEEDCLSVIRNYRWDTYQVKGTGALEAQSGGLIAVNDIAGLVHQILLQPVTLDAVAYQSWADRISGFSFDL